MEDQNSGCFASIFGLIIVIIIAAFTGGTYRTEVTIPLNSDPKLTYEDTFKEKFTANSWIGGLVKGEQPDLKNMLSKYRKNGNEVSEITIKTRFSALNLVLNFVTGFIYCPKTIIIEGTIVRSAEAASQPG
ncbi:MAG: hypothetical protein H6563_15090 [Lewinellaceae bacterium]|nr:hypothetical protein [Lewinellaceae bacterium]